MEALHTESTFLSIWNANYRAYMDSKASAAKVEEWVADPRIEITDYIKTHPQQYDSWNGFFARNLESAPDGTYPSRPVTMPERDYVIVSPTDCIMNPLVQVLNENGVTARRYIENPLQLDTHRVNCFDVRTPSSTPKPVKKGITKFGNFFFGGSLDILLFSRGMVTPAVQTRMGNQIGVINIGSAPKSAWSE